MCSAGWTGGSSASGVDSGWTLASVKYRTPAASKLLDQRGRQASSRESTAAAWARRSHREKRLLDELFHSPGTVVTLLRSVTWWSAAKTTNAPFSSDEVDVTPVVHERKVTLSPPDRHPHRLPLCMLHNSSTTSYSSDHLLFTAALRTAFHSKNLSRLFYPTYNSLKMRIIQFRELCVKWVI